MKCVILQPSYIPWRGYFHQIHKADVFVFYDDVQYDLSWRNRNRIKTSAGVQWLTIPVLSKNFQKEKTPICRIPICWDKNWTDHHFKSIFHAYARAPFFKQYQPLVENFYSSRPEFLTDFTVETTVALARALGISDKKFVRSSTLGVEGRKTDRLLGILKAVGADHYISGPSAKDYLDEPKLNENGVTLEYMRYDYPEYVQLYPPFDPAVSVLDLLFMTGPDAPRNIWGGHVA
jgi:hypothetical protein